MSQVHFKNISNVIIDKLNESCFSILIAVAWFTDTQILLALEKCVERGINVSVIINDDKINKKETFRKIISKGAKIKVTKTLMHNKFCIIDNFTLINGSYNWTFKAKNNNENIQVIKDGNLCNKFAIEFNEIFEKGILLSIYLRSEEEMLNDFMLLNNLTNEFPYFIKKDLKSRIQFSLIRNVDDIKKFKVESEKHEGFSRFFKTDYVNRTTNFSLLYYDNVNFVKEINPNIFVFESSECIIEAVNMSYGVAASINKNGENTKLIYYDFKDEEGNYIRRDRPLKYDKYLNQIF